MRKCWVLATVLLLLLNFVFSNRSAAKSDTGSFHYQNKALVLIYHDLAHTEKDIAITPQRFRSHLQALRDNGYQFISMDDFLLFKQKGKQLPDNAVLITFDDGYQSIYSKAYPILRLFRAPAATFAVIQSTDSPMQHGENFPHLSWPQMQQMTRGGMSIYSHTYALHCMVKTNEQGALKPALTGRIYDEQTKTVETEQNYRVRIKADLQLAGQRLQEELGNKFNLLSVPFGNYNDDVIRIGKDAGVELFFTTKPGINENDSNVVVKRVNAGIAGTSADRLIKKLSVYDESEATR